MNTEVLIITTPHIIFCLTLQCKGDTVSKVVA